MGYLLTIGKWTRSNDGIFLNVEVKANEKSRWETVAYLREKIEGLDRLQINKGGPTVEEATLPEVGRMNSMVVDDDENHEEEKKTIMDALNQ